LGRLDESEDVSKYVVVTTPSNNYRRSVYARSGRGLRSNFPHLQLLFSELKLNLRIGGHDAAYAKQVSLKQKMGRCAGSEVAKGSLGTEPFRSMQLTTLRKVTT
jgi:hypothetical protein